MKTCAYDEYYVEMAMENLGDAFAYAADELHLDADDFFESFLASGVAEAFGSGNPVFIAGLSGAEMAANVLERVGFSPELPQSPGAEYKTAAYWTGWVLAYYQWRSGRPFSNIHRYLSMQEIMELYTPLHEAPESKLADVLDERIRRKSAGEPTRLQFYRKLCGLSQKQLADTSGITLRSIQMYEQRNKNINKARFETVLQLARALSCRPESLFEYETAPCNQT